ncbi:hypothetical protein JL722_11525 [Aureococcus anophagefferens]|nr:hypothetical protein JL722_11525 [Aureococcus anophagefferens]
MHFVSFTLQPPGGVVAAIYGQFSAAKAQEIVVARPGGVLELLRPDEASGKVVSVATTPTFSVIRSLAPFRLTGGSRDYVVVGSDAGAVAVKLVYVMNRDASSNLTIGSPLEAHKAATVCFHAVALDVGFDNPTFAALELEYGDCDADASGEAVDETEKMLTYYELDLGLNHVTRRWSEPVSRTANLLVAVPGGDEGPSGVLVCGENWVAYKHEGHAEVYALCGKGHRSSLRVLRHGVAVSEMAVSELPGRPSAVWTVRGRHDEPYDKYIVVSFTNATPVLSIGETVEEVTDSGFLATAPTLDVALLADNALLQVHGEGIRHVRGDLRISEWKTPGRKAIEKAAANERQVAAALAGGEVIYFELDASGALAELGTKELGGRVATMQLGARAESVRFCETPDGRLGVAAGLANGVLQRAAVDASTGQLGDARARFLGSRAVRLFRVDVGGAPGLLALSSRAWLCYAHAGRLETAPLSYDALEHAAGFKSEQCPEGVVAIAGSTLRIFVPDKLGETFNQSALPLRYTPRRLAVLPGGGHLVVEADQHAYNDAERRCAGGAEPRRRRAAAAAAAAAAATTWTSATAPAAAATARRASRSAGRRRPRTASGRRRRASTRRGRTPSSSSSASEAALSCATVSFAGRGGEVFVAVGTARSLTFHPRAHEGCYVHVYRLLESRLVLLHRTEVDDVPLGLAEFRGRLLVAVGATLRMYDLGKRKLLRKTEAALAPTLITKVEVVGDRIFVADAAMSVHLARYVRDRNRLAVFADDPVGRCVTAFAPLDYDTVAVADKFGNVAVLRLGPECSDDVDDAAGDAWDNGRNGGAPNKLTQLAHYHVGDVVTALRKATLVAGGAEGIVYATVSGGVGALVPSASREDRDFFAHLEMHMRQELAPVTGRDHVSYRSYYLPVKDVADGDLCAEFARLPFDAQKRVAGDLDRTPGEVAQLEDTRNRL